MNKSIVKKEKRARRQKRIRAKIFGTAARPRISIYKSNTAIYAQLIDDEKGSTLAACSSAEAKGKDLKAKAKEAGKILATKALEKKIDMAVFDRGGFIFTGIVKELADGAREGGLKF